MTNTVQNNFDRHVDVAFCLFLALVVVAVLMVIVVWLAVVGGGRRHRRRRRLVVVVVVVVVIIVIIVRRPSLRRGSSPSPSPPLVGDFAKARPENWKAESGRPELLLHAPGCCTHGTGC